MGSRAKTILPVRKPEHRTLDLITV